MAETKEIDRLKRRLQSDDAGPLADLANPVVDALSSSVESFLAWVREMGVERALISLLIAFQLGFAAGRWGPRRAKS
jgi:hypothetical protein